MPRHVSVQGVEVVNKALETASRDTLDRVKTAIEITLNEAVTHAKSDHGLTAHDQDRFQTQTGNLVQSIHANEIVEVPGQVIEGSFSAGIEYAQFVEKGTSVSQAYPFMFTAALAVAANFKRRIAKVLGS